MGWGVAEAAVQGLDFMFIYISYTYIYIYIRIYKGGTEAGVQGMDCRMVEQHLPSCSRTERELVVRGHPQ